MKIFTSRQIKELDNYTIEHEPISSIDLMERASVAISRYITQHWDMRTPVTVFAGPGNNGGDALAVSRLLAEEGYTVNTYLFNIKERMSDDCQQNKERLEACAAVKFTEVTTQFDPPELHKGDLVVDGLFGTGLDKPLSGGYALLVKYINASKATVLSIDVPSGLMCEDNTFNIKTSIVRANITLTMQVPKLAFFFAENQRYIGKMEVLDIQLHPDGIAETASNITLDERDNIRQMMHTPNPFAHKGTQGHGLLIAGKYGMAGAACLGAKAALRTGIGKITVHTPHLNNDILQIAVPEAIIQFDLDDEVFSETTDTDTFSAVAIGPGIGQRNDTADAFIMQLHRTQVPLVLDADALNLLGVHRDAIKEIPCDTILTPHPKELENLVGHCSDSYERLTKAGELAIHQQLYIIIKGHFTCICTPSGHTYINPTGNAGMATAGCGDVLTGILLALLAQGYTQEEACRLGTYLHGLAGDIAAEELGEESLMASDIINALPRAFKRLRMNE